MKFLSIQTYVEGQAYPDAMISLGRKIDQAWGFNGFYLCVRNRESGIARTWRRIRGSGPLVYSKIQLNPSK